MTALTSLSGRSRAAIAARSAAARSRSAAALIPPMASTLASMSRMRATPVSASRRAIPLLALLVERVGPGTNGDLAC
jgi:hypothetical protein